MVRRVPPAVSARDAGLALISRINRWLIAGAVGLTGVISLAAAHAFHGRTVATSSVSAAPAASSQPASNPNAGSGSGLQQPTSAPAPAPAPAPTPSPAVSGGS